MDKVSTHDDTIAAVATPIGQAGIGIVRISGPLSAQIAEKVFRPQKPVSSLESHRLYLGYLIDPATGDSIDEVLLSVMRAPYSYTREDIIEINSHSGYLLLSRVLQIVLNQGARLARPGEFTLRAYLNGRIDLTQAEAVVDLINSKSEKGLHLATQQLQGSTRTQIEKLRQKMIDVLAHVEVAIDFPEEEAVIISKEALVKHLEEDILRSIEDLISATMSKRIWLDGVNTVIVGRVNAGKSSLLNRLLNEERAIVTPVPGTTRDIIESMVTVGGLPLRLMDTAGLRKVRDAVEKLGIQMTEQKLAEADLLLVVVDQSRPLSEDDLNIISQSRGKNSLIVLNKIDLPSRITSQAEKKILSEFPLVRISALTGEGIDQLREAIFQCVLGGEIDMTSSHVAPNLRHKEALSDSARSLTAAVRAAKKDAPIEIIAFELRNSLEVLGEIIGETTNDEILDSIFSQFCIGK